MGYLKYLLYKTDHFPKYEPDVADVLNTAIKVHEVKLVTTPNGRQYFYVFPMRRDWSYLSEILRLFASNGIILRPHRSHHYEGMVLRVPDRGQEFMKNVMDVSNDKDAFQKLVLQKYAKDHQH